MGIPGRKASKAGVSAQNPCAFSQDMSMDAFSRYLESLGLTNEKDRKLINDQGVSPQVFITLDDKDIDEVGFSFGGKNLLKSLVKELQHLEEHVTADESDANELDSGLKIGDLQVLKYKEGGQERRLKIIARISSKWKTVADRISSNPNKAATLLQQCNNDPSQCLRQLFIDCFFTNEPANNYSCNWRGIIELLKDIDEDVFAEQVKKAVLNKS